MAVDIRAAIKKRAGQMGLTTGYKINKALVEAGMGGRISNVAIDNYLAGRTEMTAGNLELLMDLLSMEIVVKKKGGRMKR